ncbi:hypothetical protein STFE110948_05550 [Streptobacillus felis]|uniref:Uncharacterized protein n=1 Tax=Streptobacillus felis TaxID=1384509 RepID=A0A7Z0PG70_9FUSO|nr:hypothetical protein [Streptobacillus felis]NYV28171.1 hypothetical protein [Streptobacillus felis]
MKEKIKFILLVVLAIWIIFFSIFILPMLMGIIIGNIMFEENSMYLSILKMIFLIILLYIIPLSYFLKKLKEYNFKHFFVIIFLLVISYILIIFI